MHRSITKLNKVLHASQHKFNKYRKHKSNMLMEVLPPNENTPTYTFTVAKWFQIIVKTNQKPQIKPKTRRGKKNKKQQQQKNTKKLNKTEKHGIKGKYLTSRMI